MRGWLQRFANTVQHFMYGRYGIDNFSTFLLISGMVVAIVSMFRPLAFMGIFAFVLIIWSYVRCFSKNFAKRQRELSRYLAVKRNIDNKLAFWKRRWRERKTHKYVKCRMCKTYMRVPKGKGKIEITCPKCRSKRIKRT